MGLQRIALPLRSSPETSDLSIPKPEGHHQNVVMVLADVPLRDHLVALAHSWGYDAWACTTPLETVHVLERHRHHVRCALIAPDLTWGSGVGELLDDEYPDVDQLLVSH